MAPSWQLQLSQSLPVGWVKLQVAIVSEQKAVALFGHHIADTGHGERCVLDRRVGQLNDRIIPLPS